MAFRLSDVAGIMDMDGFTINKRFYCKELGIFKIGDAAAVYKQHNFFFTNKTIFIYLYFHGNFKLRDIKDGFLYIYNIDNLIRWSLFYNVFLGGERGGRGYSLNCACIYNFCLTTGEQL